MVKRVYLYSFRWYTWILWRSSITFILQRKRAILVGECVRGSFSYSYFSTNKHNHARYGSWYVHQIKNRDSLYSGNEIILLVRSQMASEMELPNSCWSARRTIWLRMPKLWVVLKDSLLTMMQSLSGPWEVSPEVGFLAANVHMAFIDPKVRITQVRFCCSFG